VAASLDPVSLRGEVEAARAESQRGQPARAINRYRSLRSRIERAADPRPEVAVQQARVVLGLAAAEFEVSGRLDASLTLLGEAEALAERAAAPDLRASIRGQRGLLLLRAGRRPEALRALDRAVEVIEAAAPSDQFSILLNRGTLHLDAGSLDAASCDFEGAVLLAERAGDRLGAAKARHNLGYVEFLAGRIPRALAAMEEAAAVHEHPHPIVLLDRARVLREAGLASDADVLLADAADAFRRAGLHQDVGETSLVRAECALVEGDTERARAFARTAERIFARRGNRQWQRRAELLVLRCDRTAVDERPEDRRTAALRRLAGRARALATACRSENRSDLARAAELVALECLLRSGAAPGQPLPAIRSTDPLQPRLQVREVRALAAIAGERPTTAAREVRRGLAELGSYQNSFGSLDLRTASAVHGTALARLGMDIAERSGSAAEFFAAVERGRAISIRLARVAPPADRRTADLLAELRTTEEEARGLAGDPDAGELLSGLRARANRLQRDIRARAWEVEGGATPVAADSARLGQVRAAARDAGTAFATFVVHRGRWTAVVASRRRPALIVLGEAREVAELVLRVRADLDALAMPVLPAPMQDAVRRSLEAGLRRLDAMLVSPLSVEEPLVISCSSVLALLPWTMLPSRRGLPTVVAPSATAWLRAGPAVRPSRPEVVALAGPGLLRAEEEAASVQAAWPGARSLVGGDAGTEALRAALRSADVVHVAAHGTHQQESPLFSSLRVTDGPLYAYELDTDARTAPCVALSACEAGLSTVRPGDEGLGLTSVLLHLGSRSVLAGVARVRDDVAARVMGDVHAAMAAGTDSARALAEATVREPEPVPFVTFGGTW
jgi:tetratricopeptide (TPR) repeat protein